MEKHKCKLCSKAFANGRALGGHMKSHLAKLPIPPKTHLPPQKQDQQLSDHPTESASSLSSSSEEELERESEEKGLVYGLRENPKKSFRLVDPQFLDAGSIVQDRESETESSRKNPTRCRSKRTRSTLEPKLRKPSSTESVTELEQASSVVSDGSPEEDVALCLMMLSRDTWSSSDDSNELRPSQARERKYQCETCGKEFRSFQALGGHRTSHTKETESRIAERRVGNGNVSQKKTHECPICCKVFGSGQALGGHKRSHFLIASPAATANQNSAKLVGIKSGEFGECLIDLNFPAPMEEEDDDMSQLEISAVSDAEFIEH